MSGRKNGAKCVFTDFPCAEMQVCRQLAASKAYNRNKSRNWKREMHEANSGIFVYLHRAFMRGSKLLSTTSKYAYSMTAGSLPSLNRSVYLLRPIPDILAVISHIDDPVFQVIRDLAFQVLLQCRGNDHGIQPRMQIDFILDLHRQNTVKYPSGMIDQLVIPEAMWSMPWPPASPFLASCGRCWTGPATSCSRCCGVWPPSCATRSSSVWAIPCT